MFIYFHQWKAVLCNISSRMRDCQDKFFLRGRQMYKPKLSQGCFVLHKYGGQACYLSVSLACAFCSQQHTHIRTMVGFHPLYGRGIPSARLWNNHFEGQLAQFHFLWTPSLRLQRRPALEQRRFAAALGGLFYWFHLHNFFSVFRSLGCMQFICSPTEPET